MRVARALAASVAVSACVFVASLVSACGSTSAATHKPGAVTGHGHHPVSAKPIAAAARNTASQEGYAADVNLKLESNKLQGQVTLVGSGRFNNDPADGELHATANLPNLLAFISPVTTTVIVSGHQLVIKLPPMLAAQLKGAAKPWLTIPLPSLLKLAGLPAATLGGQLSPRAALGQLAASSTGEADLLGRAAVDGNSFTLYRERFSASGHSGYADVWLSPQTNLIKRLSVSYADPHAGLKASVRITFTGFGKQQVSSPPPPSQTTSVASIVRQVGF